MSQMVVAVSIDIEAARKTLKLSAGFLHEEEAYDKMSDVEIKNEVLKHCKCWSMKEVEV